jgi:hypothetical protein
LLGTARTLVFLFALRFVSSNESAESIDGLVDDINLKQIRVVVFVVQIALVVVFPESVNFQKSALEEEHEQLGDVEVLDAVAILDAENLLGREWLFRGDDF